MWWRERGEEGYQAECYRYAGARYYASSLTKYRFLGSTCDDVLFTVPVHVQPDNSVVEPVSILVGGHGKCCAHALMAAQVKHSQRPLTFRRHQESAGYYHHSTSVEHSLYKLHNCCI